MSVINTNVKSLIVQNAIKVNNRLMSSAMEQLSTGKRINSAKDDAAGLAVSENMTAQIRGLNMAVRNANDGISLLQTAEGAMIEQTNMLQRMRELAVQASNGTLSPTQRDYLHTEFSALREEIDRIGGNTQWNGMRLLTGEMGAASDGVIAFQVGAGTSATESISVKIGKMSTGDTAGDNPSKLGNFSAASIANPTAASSAIDLVDAALNSIASQRAVIGAGINRLTYAADNLSNISQNTSESRSRILDTDYAQATTELARTQIIQQASTAVLAQANAQPQSVLKLLQG
jgi:flagellin